MKVSLEMDRTREFKITNRHEWKRMHGKIEAAERNGGFLSASLGEKLRVPGGEPEGD